MNPEEELVRLRSFVETAFDEVSMAICFHETWKPTIFDEDLPQRMGNSFASHSLNTISFALRRELLLSLMRLWDKNGKALRMTLIEARLKDDNFFDYLVADRANKISPNAIHQIRETMTLRREEALKRIRLYMEGGGNHDIYKFLKSYRDQRLAHRQIVDGGPVVMEQVSGDEIETFYKDTLKIVEILMALVNATTISLNEIEKTHGRYAYYFWRSPMGERTKGHPDYVDRSM